MSVHRSLKSANTMKRHRSVLTRLERTRILQEKGSLDLESSQVLGLPKVKHLKIKIRKEKAAAAAPDVAGASGSATTRPGSAGTGASATPGVAGASGSAATRPGAAAPAEAGKSKKPAG